MVKVVVEMKEAKINRIEVPIKDKYLLTIREAGAYFGLGTKLLRRMAEENEGGFAIVIGNRYMIVRIRFEEYIVRFAESTKINDTIHKC